MRVGTTCLNEYKPSSFCPVASSYCFLNVRASLLSKYAASGYLQEQTNAYAEEELRCKAFASHDAQRLNQAARERSEGDPRAKLLGVGFGDLLCGVNFNEFAD